ncbi:hypothetical protein LIS66_02580 [Pseudomonas sp. HN2]|uniref:hypothetical protein n=1 Tax=Pseudomonas TaxID=286 RepID=UPI001D14063D|nr:MULTISPECIES: hypothetical protein [Pseudomonas]UEB96476.1 hypothetical protein LIS66_02580 [Pseudomonas sp. HN2]UST69843.1 hypothetical protein NF674_02575 [Pseudomonas moraviensis]
MKQKMTGAFKTHAHERRSERPVTGFAHHFPRKTLGPFNPMPATKTAIKHADAKKPGISRLPHHTHVFRKDHPARGFSRRAE